jgi:hypothetical protein
MKMNKILGFEEFINESDQMYRVLSKRYLLDNFNKVPNNSQLYDAKEEDFQDLPWYQAIKKAFPDFKLDRVKKKNFGNSKDGYGYVWVFSAPSIRYALGRNDIKENYNRIYEVYRPSSKYSHSTGEAIIFYNNTNLTHSSEFRVYLNDKESWNQIFKILYFAQSLPFLSEARSIDHITKLFSEDLKDLYNDGSLGIVGVRKNCNPYGGHYESMINFIKNLPYGIFDKIKEEFIKKIEGDPGVIQYAISQCQLPDESTEKIKGWGTRTYPKGEALDFYNFLKSEGYNPPKGFEEETQEISDLHKSLGDVGL